MTIDRLIARLGPITACALSAIIAHSSSADDRVLYHSLKGFDFRYSGSWLPVLGDRLSAAHARVDGQINPTKTLEFLIRSPKDPTSTINILMVPAVTVDELANLKNHVEAHADLQGISIGSFSSQMVFVANQKALSTKYTVLPSSLQSVTMIVTIPVQLHSPFPGRTAPLYQRQLMIFGATHSYVITASAPDESRAESDRAFLTIAHSFQIDKTMDKPRAR